LASHAEHPGLPAGVRYELGEHRAKLNVAFMVMAILGTALLAAGAVFHHDGGRRAMLAYLVAFAFVLSISLGALFFLLIQHLPRAGWSVLLRRPAEILAANLPMVAVLFLPLAASVLIGRGEVYPWARWTSGPAAHANEAHEHAEPAAAVDHDGQVTSTEHSGTEGTSGGGGGEGHSAYAHQTLDALTLKKAPYLNQWFFLVRWALYLGLWTGMAKWYYRHSTAQDADGDVKHTMIVEKWSGPLALAFALTVTFAAFDLIMSLNPHWFSTIFGVYYFAGSAIAIIAMMILCLLWLQGRGLLPPQVSREHFHDLGKLLFAFTFFWGYIAFSQYMLYWYANMPETTGWLRYHGLTTVPGDVTGWSYVALVLLFGHFLLPFVLHLSRSPKRHRAALACWAVWMLVMHYIDLWWLVMPEFGPKVVFGAPELGAMLLVLGVYGLAAVRTASKASLVPLRDPRIGESVAFQNI
jgi:hypothetical protein